MRTTLNIDDLILREIKSLQKKEQKSLGRIVSDLLALALKQQKGQFKQKSDFKWISRPMGARVDLADHDALLDAMDQAPGRGKARR